MRFPNDLKYTKEHEWAKIEGETVTIGITDHAQKALGDIVYVELPTVGRVLKQGETFGVVESIKAVSDLYAPVAGKILAVNAHLVEDPSLVNQDPHGRAWMLKIEMTDSHSTDLLIDSESYSNYVEKI